MFTTSVLIVLAYYKDSILPDVEYRTIWKQQRPTQRHTEVEAALYIVPRFKKNTLMV